MISTLSSFQINAIDDHIAAAIRCNDEMNEKPS